jgi:hypothetical protein
MMLHTLTERDGQLFVQILTTTCDWVLVEQTPWNNVAPGSLVSHPDHGIGQ